MVAYDIRFNGTGYEITRTRTYMTLPTEVTVVDSATTREDAGHKLNFWRDLEAGRARDRAGY
jgi:hypothetical protein